MCAIRWTARYLRVATAAAAILPGLAAGQFNVPVLPPVTVTGTTSVADRNQAPSTTATVTAEEMSETINVINVEDALRYMPSLIVRKRHFGDTQDPVATRTSGLGQSARSLVYVDGLLLSALIGNNNTFATPRWAMVAPDEIERIDVLYGPFSAAYPGNSMGAVIDMTTRMPRAFEFGADVATAWQDFRQYGTDDNYWTYQANAYVAGRTNGLSYWLSGNHLDAHAQPLGFATVARPANPSNAGTPVSGAFADQNRTGAPIQVLGATGFEHHVQDNAKVKLTYDFTPAVRATYVLGLFEHDNKADAKTYVKDAAGAPVYSGSLNIDGYNYNVAPSVFSNGVYRAEQEHLMQGLSLRTETLGEWDGEVIASHYDYRKDILRVPSVALPAATNGGAGTITSMDGTGWTTLDAKAYWRPQGIRGPHQTSFGVHFDLYKLASPKYNTDDWIAGGQDTLASDARGKTRTYALWAQDVWRFHPQLRATLGGRYEWWRAYDGFNYSLAPALSVEQPPLTASKFSPKASLAWDAPDDWLVTGSLGIANRFPTVTELYQTITTGPTLTVPNPNLKPEHALSGELALERSLTKGKVRLSYFQENLTDALIAQTAPLVPGSTTLFSFVQNIDRIRSRGVELVARKNDLFVTGLELSGSVTYVDSRVLEDAAFPPRSASARPTSRNGNTRSWRRIDPTTSGRQPSPHATAAASTARSTTPTFTRTPIRVSIVSSSSTRVCTTRSTAASARPSASTI